jgi:hypothetical protein
MSRSDDAILAHSGRYSFFLFIEKKSEQKSDFLVSVSSMMNRKACVYSLQCEGRWRDNGMIAFAFVGDIASLSLSLSRCEKDIW